MVVRTWRRYFLMWRAAAGRARPRNDRRRYRNGVFPQPCLGNGAPLLVFAALVVATHPRSDLLADRADADVGFLATLHFAERGLFRTRGRCVYRFGAALGYPVPRSARIFDFFPRGNVRAQLG